EQGIQLGELEQGLEIVIQIRQTQLTALLPNLLRQGDEHAKAGAIDVARLAEVDQELFLTLLELVQNLLLQLLTVSNNKLAFDIHHDDLSLFLDRETHSV